MSIWAMVFTGVGCLLLLVAMCGVCKDAADHVFEAIRDMRHPATEEASEYLLTLAQWRDIGYAAARNHDLEHPLPPENDDAANDAFQFGWREALEDCQ